MIIIYVLPQITRKFLINYQTYEKPAGNFYCRNVKENHEGCIIQYGSSLP